MSTTVTYKGSTLTTVDNATKTLKTAGKYMEGDVIITDVSSSGSQGVVVTEETDAGGGIIKHITAVEISGTKEITTNGTYDVTSFASANVNVPSGGNVWQDQDGYIHLDDEGSTPITVEPLSVSQNGTYTAPSGTAYSPVTVNVSGGGGGDEMKSLIDGSLTTLELPSGLTSIRAYAFASCQNLNISSIPSTVSSIGIHAFGGTSSTMTTVPSGVTRINQETFTNCNMSTFTVPEGVTAIDASAFDGCTELKQISLPNSLKTIGSSAFRCTKIESIRCDGVISSLANTAFHGNASFPSRIVSADFPNMSLLALGTAFGYGTAASACQKLSRADIGKTKAISASAFLNCIELATLILRRDDSICTLSNVNAFNNTPLGTNGIGGTVYVPSALISSYQTATNWSTLYNAGTITFAAIEGSEYEL